MPKALLACWLHVSGVFTSVMRRSRGQLQRLHVHARCMLQMIAVADVLAIRASRREQQNC